MAISQMFVSLVEERFSFYDLDAIVRALNILVDDCEMVIGMETTTGNRINSALALPSSTLAFGTNASKGTSIPRIIILTFSPQVAWKLSLKFVFKPVFLYYST